MWAVEWLLRFTECNSMSGPLLSVIHILLHLTSYQSYNVSIVLLFPF